MRFMLLQAYGGVELEGCTPMNEWAPEDVRAHIDFQHTLNAELLERGELVDAQGLAGPDVAKFVVSDGVNPPKIIDGPYPESKELLAGVPAGRRGQPGSGTGDCGPVLGFSGTRWRRDPAADRGAPGAARS